MKSDPNKRDKSAVRHPIAYIRNRMHRRIFWGFGVSIALTGLVLWLVSMVIGGTWSFRRELERARGFLVGRFTEVWDDPSRREALARSIAEDLRLEVRLEDAHGERLGTFGGVCTTPVMQAKIERAGVALGVMNVCAGRTRQPNPARLAGSIFIAIAVLWATSGILARKLAKPLVNLAHIAEQAPKDVKAAREQLAQSRRTQHGEVGVVAGALEEMLIRVEKQIADQRELLAGVSHEIRTPLARMRLLVELARPDDTTTQSAKMISNKTLDDLESEILEMDNLVAQLLATARLDFATLEKRPCDGADMVRHAVARAGLPAHIAVIDDRLAKAHTGEDTSTKQIPVDPTLIARALANLLENAARHGGGVEVLRLTLELSRSSPASSRATFQVEDSGPGIDDDAREKIFLPFYQQRPSDALRTRGSVGLGLSLVRRIAEAHGGQSFARSLPGKGAVVGFWVPLNSAMEPLPSSPVKST